MDVQVELQRTQLQALDHKALDAVHHLVTVSAHAASDGTAAKVSSEAGTSSSSRKGTRRN